MEVDFDARGIPEEDAFEVDDDIITNFVSNRVTVVYLISYCCSILEFYNPREL